MAAPTLTAYQQNTYDNGFNINLESNGTDGNGHNNTNRLRPLVRGLEYMSTPFKNSSIMNGIGAAAMTTSAVLNLYTMNQTDSTAFKVCFGTLAGLSLVASQVFTSRMMS